jgi:hypothetical protein
MLGICTDQIVKLQASSCQYRLAVELGIIKSVQKMNFLRIRMWPDKLSTCR